MREKCSRFHFYTQTQQQQKTIYHINQCSFFLPVRFFFGRERIAEKERRAEWNMRHRMNQKSQKQRWENRLSHNRKKEIHIHPFSNRVSLIVYSFFFLPTLCWVWSSFLPFFVCFVPIIERDEFYEFNETRDWDKIVAMKHVHCEVRLEKLKTRRRKKSFLTTDSRLPRHACASLVTRCTTRKTDVHVKEQ